MATTRGNQDTIDQTQVRLMSGGAAAVQIVTTTSAPKTAGNGLMWNSDGNAVDTGTTLTGSGSGITVNATATVQVNSTDASFDNTVLVNGA